jgi:hypothetical protein
MKLPSREDVIYEEIEEFKDYELTNCIAYEMAVRVDEVKEYLKKWENGRRKWSNGETDTNEVSIFSKILTNHGFNSVLDILMKPTSQYFVEYVNKKSKYVEIDGKFGKDLSNHFFCVDTEKKELENEGFIHKNIKMEFSRPKLTFKETTNLNLNLSLSEDELIAQIKKIKAEYNKDNSFIKTPLEMLGEDLEKADNSKYPKKPKATIFADWFFIYDYWKYNHLQGLVDADIWIDLELMSEIPYKQDMVRKIRDKMRFYIDELHCKELATGMRTI